MRISWRRYPVLLLVLVSQTACFMAAHTSSPWEFGAGARLAPGFALGAGRTTIHPMASYTYLSFDGGYDGLLEGGAQVRHPVTPVGGSGFWLGGEGAVSRLSTHIKDSGAGSFATTGWSLTALAGVPVGKSRWGLNLYAGAGVSNYGSAGKNVRVGVDLQPWFLKKK